MSDRDPVLEIVQRRLNTARQNAKEFHGPVRSANQYWAGRRDALEELRLELERPEGADRISALGTDREKLIEELALVVSGVGITKWGKHGAAYRDSWRRKAEEFLRVIEFRLAGTGEGDQ